MSDYSGSKFWDSSSKTRIYLNKESLNGVDMKMFNDTIKVNLTTPKSKSKPNDTLQFLKDWKEKLNTMVINGNTFQSGDEVTFITGQTYVIQGKIHVQYDDMGFFICHNDDRFPSCDSPELYGYKYSFLTKIEYMHNSMIFHKIDLEPHNLSNRDNIFTFLNQFGYNIRTLLTLKLEGISQYNLITAGDEQGFAELHSKERSKKLPIKLSRLIKKLNTSLNTIVSTNEKNMVGVNITDDVIESIHNKWMLNHPTSIQMKMLVGEEILQGYMSRNYIKGGCHLQNSCMTDRMDNLKLYTNNPKQISLATFYQNGKVIARTIVWKCDDGKLYHDRIYHGLDWVQAKAAAMLKEQGIIHINTISDNKVTLDKIDFDLYPFVDSFFNVHFKKKMLYYDPSNKIKTKYIIRSSGGYITQQGSYIEE